MDFLKKYKAVWLFLVKFFAAYAIGVLLYNFYLSGFTQKVDGITAFVTEQVATMFSWTLPEISTFYSCENPISEVRYFDVTLILMIEGCNAVSVMLLFIAFIIAFTGPIKNYLWFAPLGVLLLYLANLFRIYLIGMIILYADSYTQFAHDYLFPGIIYGTVFLLWVLWVKYLAHKSVNAV